MTGIKDANGSTTTYAYDANGNLLKTSGSGVQAVYTSDLYNRLVSYSQGGVTESYTYDAEGVRRSKTTGDTTVIFISDTTGELSHTLAETDIEGNATAVYTRGDTLISQTRGDVTSTYLYDGHGDVRGLINANGRFSDTYRYNAYGELLASKGDTENHYLYTGEYYDGTSGLYYLRARYMNPSTGTFISMDTYEGSIYDPDTLHKYLYANGNPVKYSDPSGNMFDFSTVTLGLTIRSILQTTLKMSLNGVLSGITNAAITNFLGGTGEDINDAFWKGFGIGFGVSGILYAVAAIEAVAFARLLMIVASANVVLSSVMMIASVVQHKEKETLVYGTLTILSLISWYQAYNLYDEIIVTGDKGAAVIEIEVDEADIISEVDTKLSLEEALNELDTSGLRPGQTELHTSQLNEILKAIQNNYDPSKAYSSVYSDGTNRYLVEGHHTTVAFKMLGKESAMNMNVETNDIPSTTNVYWTKKWYQFWRQTIRIVED